MILNPIDGRHENGSKGQIRIGGRIWAAKLNSLGHRVGGIHRNSKSSRAISLRVGQVDRSLKTRHQSLVTVGGGIGQSQQGRGMPKDPAQGMKGQIGQACIARSAKERLTGLPERQVNMHARAAIAVDRLRHKGGGSAMATGNISDDVLVEAHLISHSHEALIPHVDFTLTSRGNLMMLGLNINATLNHREHHFRADVECLIRWWHRAIALPMPDLIAKVAVSSTPPIPLSLC